MLSNTSAAEKSSVIMKRDLVVRGASTIGLLNWFRKKEKRKPEEELLARAGKLQTNIKGYTEKKPKTAKRKRKKKGI